MTEYASAPRHPRNLVAETITRIYDMGMTTTSGGNISVRDAEGRVWITPAAVDKGTLGADDIVCVHPDGSREGRHAPSSELPFHQAIYAARPDLNAIVHAHPSALVSFSIVRKVPDLNIIPQANAVCGTVGYAAYACPGTEALGKSIAGEFRKGHDCVLMENHGTVVGGSDLDDAFLRFETFEFAARTLVNAGTIGEPIGLDDGQLAAFESRVPGDLPEMEEVEHPTGERSIRADIAGMLRRSCRQGMMISSYGSMSVRWRDNDFLITPRDRARSAIGGDDIVQVRGGRRERGKFPSRAVSVHREIYELNPHVNSIISTQPPNLMAFAVSRQKIDVRTIPESWIFLQDIPTLPFGSQYEDCGRTARMFSPDRPAVLIENEGCIVTGADLLQTFDRLEVAEFSARSLIMARSLGTLVPINEEQVEELRKAWL